eukprot:CAMPEP_0118692642 /NCGR_PEP_ID=MMETSP0800-20121206/11418_1 /TAXON_ID=210618 ORGANISM="Striatella unipunctata, Strain CCMP2910" /NCGR_SAMPLE_ID=MMETSP0800 /ASSEMBLY_ACC=CAM_ASM_000638 /LENGTH=230 /DNA_ID=CAMNT_0006590693 /DNA_START=102 /DNA_END=791 /DNA_ORIENTATION=-
MSREHAVHEMGGLHHHEDQEMEKFYQQIQKTWPVIELDTRKFDLLIQLLNDPTRIFKRLQFRRGRLTSDHTNVVARLSEALESRSSQLEELDLESFKTNDGGAHALSNFVKTTSSLCKLRLNDCKIDGTGAFLIGESLHTNTCIQKLHLDNNSIGDDGAIILARGLETNQHLETLSLNKNNIGFQGAAAFANFLQVNSTLSSLGLPFNNIQDKGAVAIAKALSMNCSSKL